MPLNGNSIKLVGEAEKVIPYVRRPRFSLKEEINWRRLIKKPLF